MTHIDPVFSDLEDHKQLPNDYKYIHCYLIFDVKFELIRNVRFVANSQNVSPPLSTTFASMISCETICIMFTIADLNDLKVKSIDIKNSFIQAPLSKKLYTVLGTEFG